MSELPAKRRWFRFSLRTLFIVVTAICLWLGWQVHLVRERNDLQKHLSGLTQKPHEGVSWTFERNSNSVPILWQWMGANTDWIPPKGGIIYTGSYLSSVDVHMITNATLAEMDV